MEQYVSLVWWEGKGERQINDNYICKSLDYLSIIFEFKSFTYYIYKVLIKILKMTFFKDHINSS